MKKSKYLINTIDGIKEVGGFVETVYTSDGYPITLGYDNRGTQSLPLWRVTELSTGLLCSTTDYKSRKTAHNDITKSKTLDVIKTFSCSTNAQEYKDKIQNYI